MSGKRSEFTALLEQGWILSRHMDARAASDLADWLVRLELEGKADRTLYEYVRKLAPLLREFPDKQTGDFTAADIELVLARVPKRSQRIGWKTCNG